MSALTAARPVAENRGIAAAKALTTTGLVLALFATTPALILTGIAALVTGCALAFRFGITTGRWER